MILCDYREPKDVLRILGDEATIGTYPCDYQIWDYLGNLHMYEHVTASGLVQDIESDRMDFEKIPKMQRENPKSITLLVEGKPESGTHDGFAIIDKRGPTRWRLKSLYGKRLYYQEILGINIEWVGDWRSLAYYLLEAEEYYSELHEYKLPARPLLNMEPVRNRQLYFLAGLKPENAPGVDVGRATNILKLAESHGVSLSEICSWSLKDWMQVDKIGKKTAQELVKFLNTPVSFSKETRNSPVSLNKEKSK